MKVIVWKCDRCGDVKERTPKKKELPEPGTPETPWRSRPHAPPPPKKRRFAVTLPTGWTIFEHEEKPRHLCEGCSTGLKDWMADGGEK
jgi:ribosomal protein L37AE/L43A